jgi:hypothetical protein
MDRSDDTRHLTDLGSATNETMGIPMGDLEDTLGQFVTAGAFSED